MGLSVSIAVLFGVLTALDRLPRVAVMHGGKRFLLMAVVTYLNILLVVHLYDQFLLLELNKFDLDGDGIFSGDEISSVQADAMFRVVNDVGRNFTVFFGVFYSIVIALTYLVGRRLFLAYIKLSRRS